MHKIGKPDNLRLAACVTLVALSLPAGTARGEDHYYVVVFASQGDVNLPRFSHTFATFVKAAAAGPRPEAWTVEARTISWSPASGEVRAARFIPERGINLDLAASLRWAGALGAHVSRWGPYEVQKELYDLACARIARLQAGQLEYKTFDIGLRPRFASNCIHAVCDLSPEDGLLVTGVNYGERASWLVVQHFRRWMINPAQTHEWICKRLGLDGLPIEPRKWSPAGR